MTVFKNNDGPLWPLGVIIVTTGGTPVSIMSLVDSTSINAPETPTPNFANNATATGAHEFTDEVSSLIFTPCKADGTANAGIIFVCYKGGTRADSGSFITVIRATDPPFVLDCSSKVRNGFSPYYITIDAATNGDGCAVCAVIT